MRRDCGPRSLSDMWGQRKVLCCSEAWEELQVQKGENASSVSDFFLEIQSIWATSVHLITFLGL